MRYSGFDNFGRVDSLAQTAKKRTSARPAGEDRLPRRARGPQDAPGGAGLVGEDRQAVRSICWTVPARPSSPR
jgi:hypothetical protein